MQIEKKSFFEAISLADMEKVHSAVIGWMLSDDCGAFDIEAKSRILKGLFEENDSSSFKSIEVTVEIQNIDILILTEDYNGEKVCWVIENKVKSSQHSNQLNKYVDIIESSYDSYSHKYCLLSLIEEKPICRQKWINKTYDCLVSSLKSELETTNNKNNVDFFILCEYQQSIFHMTSVLKVFLEDHKSYCNVFTDGSIKKKDKNDNPSFISKNNLETIFQKCFLGIILNRMQLSEDELKEMKIAETRGVALIDYLRKTTINGRYESHIQIQNGTFKVFLGLMNGIKEEKVNFIEIWKPKIVKIADSYKMSVNPPKNYPSISISCPEKDWYYNSIDEIVKNWKDKYNQFKEIQDKILEEVKKFP